MARGIGSPNPPWMAEAVQIGDEIDTAQYGHGGRGREHHGHDHPPPYFPRR
jgi:hypothetical protein